MTMMRHFSRLRRDRRAVVTLDFAIIATPLLMLVFGTVEFGRLLWAREALQMTAVEAARCMGVVQTSCSSGGAFSRTNTQSFVVSTARTWGIALTADNMTLTSSGLATSGVCNGLAEITINYTFQSVVPGLLSMLSNGKALSGHACFPRQP